MPETRVPDPTLMARLQLSVKGVDWAASLVREWQHVTVGDEWSPHQHLWHVLGVDRDNYRVRVRRMLAEDRPALEPWDNAGHMGERYDPSVDIAELAEQFMQERAVLVDVFKGLTPEQWARTGTWPDGREVDVAWVAHKALWHGLDHFAALLGLHGEFEAQVAPRWLA